MLTWCAIASFTLAALAAARWFRRSRDALGRPRRFPVASVVGLVLAGAAALVPVVRHAALERDLSRVASALVGVPVQVHCQSVGEALVSTDQHLGFVAWDAEGHPEHRTTITRDTCDALANYRGSDHARPTEDEVRAVHVLSHEARHMAGETDEARAECQAMQRDAQAARLLGADPAQAVRLARFYAAVLYRTMPAEYVSSACTPGGSWDEHLTDAPWAAP